MFDSGHILDDQSDVESKEHGNDNQHAEIHQIANDCEIIGVERSFKSAILRKIIQKFHVNLTKMKMTLLNQVGK